jgi:hypothetical protein
LFLSTCSRHSKAIIVKLGDCKSTNSPHSEQQIRCTLAKMQQAGTTALVQ